jgi:chemotaxis protein MotB
MSRKKKHPAHESHERWLVSYADFITLLFAFFVVMFASSQTDRAKVHEIAEAVKKALEEDQVASAIAGILGGTVDDKGKGNAQMKGPGGVKKGADQVKDLSVLELLPAVDQLSADLSAEIRAGKLKVSMENRGLVVSLRQAAFFPSGDDSIDPQAYDSIQKVSNVIRGLPNPIRLEGHTDSRPISTQRFRSNWDLSAARAISMLNMLTERFEVPASRTCVAGYADTVPVDSNDTEEGRALNRRVDIVLLRHSAVQQEPPRMGKPSPAGPPPQAKKSSH